jgi:hypothetical protein
MDDLMSFRQKLVRNNRRFGGAQCLHLQDQAIPEKYNLLGLLDAQDAGTTLF